jgi:hypothetical protein
MTVIALQIALQKSNAGLVDLNAKTMYNLSQYRWH